MSLTSINPLNGSVIRIYEEDTAKQIDLKIDAVHQTWLAYRTTDFEERAKLLLNVAQILQDRKTILAELMAAEMGKPIQAGEAEILKCVSVCEYYASHAPTFLADQLIETEASKSYVAFRPIGVVLAIMPWNFPFWQVFRFLAPALMAGNCAVLKHSSNVTGCALAIEKIIKEAGYPVDVFEVLVCNSKAINDVIKNPLIKAVTLTGSTQAGKKVAAQAAKYLKKTVLELGGSDPYLVLEDADLPTTAKICAEARLINNGQSCIAGKRFIVIEKVAHEFLRLFKAEMESKITGDPFDAKVDLGPMARVDLRDELHAQVVKSIKQGAKCVLGGTIPSIAGGHAFYQPTILTEVKKGNLAYHEEIFGPVAAVIIAKDEEEAVEIANDTSFGLGAAVFTKDKIKGEHIASKLLEAGACFVNEGVKSDPRLPFGGIKESGYGRELGLFGIHEFVNIKTVYVK